MGYIGVVTHLLTIHWLPGTSKYTLKHKNESEATTTQQPTINKQESARQNKNFSEVFFDDFFPKSTSTPLPSGTWRLPSVSWRVSIIQQLGFPEMELRVISDFGLTKMELIFLQGSVQKWRQYMQRHTWIHHVYIYIYIYIYTYT